MEGLPTDRLLVRNPSLCTTSLNIALIALRSKPFEEILPDGFEVPETVTLEHDFLARLAQKVKSIELPKHHLTSVQINLRNTVEFTLKAIMQLQYAKDAQAQYITPPMPLDTLDIVTDKPPSCEVSLSYETGKFSWKDAFYREAATLLNAQIARGLGRPLSHPIRPSNYLEALTLHNDLIGNHRLKQAEAMEKFEAHWVEFVDPVFAAAKLSITKPHKTLKLTTGTVTRQTQPARTPQKTIYPQYNPPETFSTKVRNAFINFAKMLAGQHVKQNHSKHIASDL